MAHPPLKCVIVGSGVIGRWHAMVLDEIDGATLVGVIDSVSERATQLGEQHNVPAFTTFEEAVQGVEFDAAIICTPSGIHAEHTIEALEAGKHVMIEKPIDISLEAAHKIQEAADKSDRAVTVISQHRFDRSTEIVYDLIEQQKLGRITSAIASCAWWRSQEYYDSGDWRGTWELDGGGALMNQTVHTIDLLLGACGPAKQVFTYAGTLAHERIEVEDTAVATVLFENGALGVIHGTTAAYPGLSASLRIFGSEGSAVIEDDELIYIHASSDYTEGDEQADPSKNQLNQHNTVADPHVIRNAGTRTPGSLTNAHHYQWKDFVDAINAGRAPRIGIKEATDAIELILAIYESARTGKPVDIK